MRLQELGEDLRHAYVSTVQSDNRLRYAHVCAYSGHNMVLNIAQLSMNKYNNFEAYWQRTFCLLSVVFLSSFCCSCCRVRLNFEPFAKFAVFYSNLVTSPVTFLESCSRFAQIHVQERLATGCHVTNICIFCGISRYLIASPTQIISTLVRFRTNNLSKATLVLPFHAVKKMYFSFD